MAASYAGIFTGGGTSGTGDRSASGTPAVGDLLVVFCDVRVNANTAPTCSDNQGGTYTLIDTAIWGASAHTGSCFVRDSLVSSAVSHTVTVATGSNVSGNVAVVRVAGMTNTGAAAVLHKGKQENQSAGTPAPALNAACDTANVTIGAVNSNDNPANLTAPTSWTERADIGQATSPVGLHIVTRDSGFTGTTVTWGSATATVFSSLIIELDGSSGVSFYDQPIGHLASAAALRGVVSPLAASYAVGHIPSDAALYGLTLTIPSIDFYSTDFETESAVSEIFDVAQGTTVSLATDQFHSGSKSLKCHETGTASGSTRTMPAGLRTLVVRFWARVSATPGATQAIFNFNIGGASGLVVRLATSGAIQVGFNGGTFQGGGTFALNTWHSVDLKIDVTTSSFTCDWAFDGVDKTQATFTGTAADIDTMKFANAGANTLDLWIDELQLCDDLAQYKLPELGDETGPAAYTVTIAPITTHTALHGLGSPLTGAQPVGHLASGKTLHGLGSPLVGAQALGHLASPNALHGLALPLTADYGIGHIDSAAALYGLDSFKTIIVTIGHLRPASRTAAGALLSYSPQEVYPDVESIEASAGRRFVGVRWNNNVEVTSQGFGNTHYDLGRTHVFRNANAQFAPNPVTPMGMRDIADGVYDDDYLTPLFQAFIDNGRFTPLTPLLFCFHHEMFVDSTSQAGIGPIGTPGPNGDTDDYVDAWHHVRLVADAMGFSMFDIDGNYLGGPALWCLVPNQQVWMGSTAGGTPSAGETFADINPNVKWGGRHFDFLGLDFYNKVVSGHMKYGTDAEAIFADVVADAVAEGVPLVIPEFGIADDKLNGTVSQEAADFLDSFTAYFSSLGTSGPGTLAFIGCTVGDELVNNYYPASSPLKEAAFNRLARDPFFADGLGPAVRGLDSSLAGFQALGHLSGGSPRGFQLPLTASYPIGHLATYTALHGFGSPLAATQPVGHVASHAALHGLAYSLAGSQALGKVASHTTLRGVLPKLTQILGLGHLPSSKAIRGLVVTVQTPRGQVISIPIYENPQTVPTFANALGVPCYNGDVTVPVYTGPALLPVFPTDFTVPVQ